MNTPLHLGSFSTATSPRYGAKFELPLSIVTATIAILARKGRGKTYTAAVLAEELLDAGQVPIIIDPTGAHWGLKSSHDGTKAGYPVVVFGGEHADLPLEEQAGETIARAIVEQRFPSILDLSLLRKGASHRFLAAFLETLYRLNRQPVHLLADEADDYAPQRPFGEDARVLGAMEDIVRRGRIRGIGCTMITQRPAVLNKNVLTQADMLVALGMNHPKDIDAIDEWVAVHGAIDTAQKMIASLPAMPIGTAWFWAPSFDIFAQVKVRSRKTFDSSATPKAGEKVVAPKQLAAIDVAKLGAEIVAAAQRAKENDPRELKAEIARLKAELARKPTAVNDPQAMAAARAAGFEECRRRTINAQKRMAEGFASLKRVLDPLAAFAADCLSEQPDGPLMTVHQIQPKPVVAHVERVRADTTAWSSGEPLPKGERAVLTVCAQYPDGATREQLTILTGYKRSSRDAYIQRLRERGFIESLGENMLQATPAGLRALGSFEPLPTGSALREHWLRSLPEGERKVLEFVCRAFPNAVERTQLDSATGYQRSSRDAYLQRLGARRLVASVGRGAVKASEELFDL